MQVEATVTVTVPHGGPIKSEIRCRVDVCTLDKSLQSVEMQTVAVDDLGHFMTYTRVFCRFGSQRIHRPTLKIVQ